MRRSRQWIENLISQRIRDGVYAPGSVLPTHRELIRELEVSSATLQQAFHRLSELGYVDLRSRQGTLVAERLPNRACLAMVLPHDSGNQFYYTAQRVGEAWKERGFTFRTYALHQSRRDSAAHRQLCRDLEAGGIAGLVFIHPPYYLGDSPVLRSTLPKVVIDSMGQQEVDLLKSSVISPSYGEVPERIIGDFQRAGRRRIAGMMAINRPGNGDYLPTIRRMGLETRPEWWPALPITEGNAICVHDVARLLFSGRSGQRPDCLIIADDNLAAPAIEGILEAGLDVPMELMVAVHANFPTVVRLPVPCTQFGNDMHSLLQAAIAEIERQLAGEAPRVVPIPAAIRAVG